MVIRMSTPCGLVAIWSFTFARIFFVGANVAIERPTVDKGKVILE